MKKNRAVLFADMDNTLIYSRRHEYDVRKIWVEYLHGRQKSFMTERSYMFFREQDWLDVIPITTRTEEQCESLKDFFSRMGWRDALICNGAIMLHNNEEDRSWKEESLKRSEKDQKYFLQLLHLARTIIEPESIIAVEPFLFYIRSDKTDEVYSIFCRHGDLSHLQLFKDSRKVYCIPKSLDKGRAVQRFRERFPEKICMAAGDSVFDLPMLEEADICFYPDTLHEPVRKTSGKKVLCREIFADKICDELEKRRNEEKNVDQ